MRAFEYARFVAVSFVSVSFAELKKGDGYSPEGDEFVMAINGVVQDWTERRQGPFDVLNAMGAEGWELAAVIDMTPPSPDAYAGNRYQRMFILKRERAVSG
jgi:hypothetical protein